MAHAPCARSKPQEDEAAQTLRAPSSKFCIQRVGSGTGLAEQGFSRECIAFSPFMVQDKRDLGTLRNTVWI